MMEIAWTAAIGIAGASWAVLVESAPFMLVGFFFAGLLKALVPDRVVAGMLGKRSIGSVLKASLIGVPLPLCSCSVLPTALGLRRQGASRGATTAFLISTPETGADSIAVTYALLGPFMAVIRPVAAFLTATLAGVLADRIETDNGDPCGAATESGGLAMGCGCGGACAAPARPEADGPAPLGSRLRAGMAYAFQEMMADIGLWFLIGVAVAGAISYFIPEGALSSVPGGEWGAMLAMLVVGLPLYVCASSSTPIAASLALKGLSPGAALVFLLAGPATNGATLTVVLKTLGRRTAVAYVAAIAASSLALGWLTNRLYDLWGHGLAVSSAGLGEGFIGKAGVVSAVAFLLLFVLAWLRERRAHS